MVVNQIVDQKNVRQLIRTFVNISKNLQKIVRNVTIFFMYLFSIKQEEIFSCTYFPLNRRKCYNFFMYLFLYQYQYFIEIDDICEHFQKLMKIVGKFVEICRNYVYIVDICTNKVNSGLILRIMSNFNLLYYKQVKYFHVLIFH